jgi:4-aminobutyrate aminotransferase/(S)-3-amino-2-methylpropionate transaminase
MIRIFFLHDVKTELLQLILLDAVLKTIKKDDLLGNTLATGDILLSGLKDLESRFPQYLKNTRGRGTFCAIDCVGARRDDVLAKLRSLGVHAGGCGEAAIRLRPALIFQPWHAHIFLQKLEDVLLAQ